MKESETKLTRDVMLTHLCMALKYCQLYDEVRQLEYDPEREAVICTYKSNVWNDDLKTQEVQDFTVEINVACDSNAAVIKDVINRLSAFFG